MSRKAKRTKKKGKKADSKKKSTPKIKEEYARILNYLPQGHPDDSRPVYQKKPIVQAVGEDTFVLIELSPKKNKIPTGYERVYIGEGEREVIDHVIKRLKYKELTQTAKERLPHVLKGIVNNNQKKFLQLFNNPKGILKIPKKRMRAKTLSDMLNELGKGPFSDFGDITRRVKGLHHPEKIIVGIIEDQIIDGKQGLIDLIMDKTKKIEDRKQKIPRKIPIVKERTENIGHHNLGVRVVQKNKLNQ